PDALDEDVELLAVIALGLVVADPALDRLGHALCRNAGLEAMTEVNVAALIATADVRDVRGDGVLPHLDRRAVEADVGDVVLRAAVGAAAHLDVDPAGQRIVELHLNDALLDGLVQTHRARDAELAGVGA